MSQDDLALALGLADRADALTSARFGALDLRIDTKPDLTPVTDADRAVETELRDVLGRERPEDSVVGEEFGGTATLRGRQWIIDPIDGTKNFVRGVPVWASLIALLEDGVPSVGVVSAPALQRRWWAARGQGAFAAVDGGPPRRLSVSSVAQLGSASLSFSSLSGWAQRGLRDRFIDADRRGVAGPRLRRLSVLLPGRRGRSRHRRRTGGVGVGPRGARHLGARGGWDVHRLGRHGGPARRQRRGDQRPTASTRCWPASGLISVNYLTRSPIYLTPE